MTYMNTNLREDKPTNKSELEIYNMLPVCGGMEALSCSSENPSPVCKKATTQIQKLIASERLEEFNLVMEKEDTANHQAFHVWADEHLKSLALELGETQPKKGKSRATELDKCQCTCHTDKYFDEPHIVGCEKNGKNPAHPYTHFNIDRSES